MNNIFSLNLKLVKHCLKNKKRITLSLIVTFLITGGISITPIFARDLRSRQREKNNVIPDRSGGGPGMNTAANGTDVVNIVDVNQDGISHNKFIDLSVGSGNALIFNNSMIHGVSQFGGYVTKNTNLTKNASVILNEVKGNNISTINGGVEIFGTKADFILANENGISLNGATFINTNGVTLATGSPSINNGNINFDINRGEINLNGVGTSGSYFNVLAKTVLIQKEISGLKNEPTPDISIIAGENKISLEKNKFVSPKIIESKVTKTDKYGIYATQLGAMYGKNIKLISTDEGLGVKHEGLIYSSQDIEIDSKGDIILANLSAKNNLKITGKKNLSTIKGSYTNEGKLYSNALTADKDINISVNGDITLNSALQSVTGDIDISSNSLENNGIISANKELKLATQNLTNTDKGVIKANNIAITATKGLSNHGEIRQNLKDKNEFVSADGSLKFDISLGSMENFGNISGRDLTILTQSLINGLNGKIIITDGDIILTTTLGDFLNTGDILADKNISIISQKNIKNFGKIGSTNISIQGIDGEFFNAGQITAVNELHAIINNLINAGSSQEIEKYLMEYSQYITINLKKININIQNLQEKIKNEVSSEKLTSLNEALNYFMLLKKNFEELKEKISQVGNLGILSGNNINIKSIENIHNQGMILAKNNIEINTNKNLINDGVIEAEKNIILKAILNIVNSQRVIAKNNLTIEANSFISTGDEIRLKEYLNLVKNFNAQKLEELNIQISKLEDSLLTKENLKEIQKIEEELKSLKNERDYLNSLKSQISAFKEIGILEGLNINITTKNTLKNNGIILGKGDLNLSSNETIESSGAINVANSANIIAKSFISNTLSVGDKLQAILQQTFSSKDTIVKNNIEVSAKKIETLGKVHSADGFIKLTGDLFNNINGDISSKGSILLDGKIDNKGAIITSNNLISTSGKEFFNSGNIDVQKNMEILTNNFNSEGNINLGEKLVLNSTGDFFNSGSIEVKDKVQISSKHFKNINEIKSTDEISLKSLNNLSNSGKIYGAKKLKIESDILENTGEIIASGLDLNTVNGLKNFGSLQSKGNLSIKNIGNKSSILNLGDILATEKINIEAQNSYLTSSGKIGADKSITTQLNGIKNTGTISSKENINLNIGEIDSELGNITSLGDINIKNSANLANNKIQSIGDVVIDTTGSLNNNGIIISNSNINIKSNTLVNEVGSTIWAGTDILIETLGKIYNKLLATIEAVGDVSLTAKSIVNEGGNIKSGKNMTLKANSIENKSNLTGELTINHEKIELLHIWKDIAINHWDRVIVTLPVITNNLYIKDKATISAGTDILIDAKTTINESGTISASKNIDINGNLENKTLYSSLDIEWFLKNTNVELKWETKTLGLNLPLNSGTSFNGTLEGALKGGYFGGNNGYYEALTKQNNEQLEKVLSALLGSDWKGHSSPISQDKWNYDASFKYYPANANAQIFAGNNFTHSNGIFTNNGGESGGNKDINIKIGNFSVDGSTSELDTNIKDINSITQLGPIKLVTVTDVIAGEITLDGVTIKAETGNTAGSIAVAGTINPIIFIEIPEGENGIFKPATLKPDGFQPLFETNIEFINQDNMFGSKYFLEQIGYDISKPTTVIGDSYYELILLQKMIKEVLGYTGTLTNIQMKTLLDNAISLGESLGLEIGKPLTPNQINSLDKDIIWYVEVEINGTKVLTPQIYLSKESRINISKNQGSDGTSIIKAGGDITIDTDNFTNNNGNIVGNGNIIIKSEKNINNNSSGTMNAGIISLNGNIALDANQDINMKGGNLTGDNILLAGNNVNISATIGLDKNGNQIISDKGSITSKNGIQIDAEKDINLKGAQLTSNGIEIEEEEKEKEEIKETSVPPEKKKKEKLEKNLDYYKELLKKDAKDIIEGDSGSINLNAGGNVNLEDIYTVKSSAQYNYIDYANYENEIAIEAKSNGSSIKGSNININAEEAINIKGSSLSTNMDEKNKKQGSINLEAKQDINILDTQTISLVKKDSKKSSFEQGLYTEKEVNHTKNTSLSKGSQIDTDGDLTIKSNKNLQIQGSSLSSGAKTNISAEGDIDILDGKDSVKENNYESRYQVLGGSKNTSKKESLESKGSNIVANNDISIIAKENIKIVNGGFNTGKNININANKNISIEAGRNEYHEMNESFGVGIYVDGSVGVGGVGVAGSANTIDMTAQGEVTSDFYGELNKKLDGSNEKTPTTSGKPHMDQLINSEIGVKIQYDKNEIDKTNWSESNFNTGRNLNITAGEVIDIGGGDYTSKGDVTIEGNEIKSTKYENLLKNKNTNFEISLKQSQGVSSSITDTINTAKEMDENIKSGEANTGVLVAQGIGAATNLIFNDLAGVFSKQSINLGIGSTENLSTKENITTIEAKNVTIKAKKEDITLNGIKLSAEENILLDAKKNLNINAAKQSSTSKGFKVDLEAQLEETAGYSALWGGNADIGVGGSASVNVTTKNSEVYTNSEIISKNNISIKSGENVDILGGNVEAKKNIDLNIKGNLNISSIKSKNESNDISANAGGNASMGGSTNTIGKAKLGFNAGGGNLWENGESVVQSGIKAGEKLLADIGKDVNLNGAILGSEKNDGSLKAGGNLNLNDLVTTEKKGGAQLTFSGGFTGDFGVDGTIGDTQNKTVKTKSAIGLNIENISIGGNIGVNGEQSEKNNLYTDLSKTQIVEKNESSKGGSLSMSVSVDSIKDVKNKLTGKNTGNNEGQIILPQKENTKTNNDFKNSIDIDNNAPTKKILDSAWEEMPVIKYEEGPTNFNDNYAPNNFGDKTPPPVPPRPEILKKIDLNEQNQKKDSDKEILEQLVKSSQKETIKLEKELGQLLDEQSKILEKQLKDKKLKKKDKKRLDELQIKLKEKTEQLNKNKELELRMEKNLKTYLDNSLQQNMDINEPIYESINEYIMKENSIYESTDDYVIKDNPIYESIENIDDSSRAESVTEDEPIYATIDKEKQKKDREERQKKELEESKKLQKEKIEEVPPELPPRSEEVLLSKNETIDISKNNNQELSSAELDALKKYIDKSAINTLIRNDNLSNDAVDEIKNLDNALKKFPKYKGDLSRILYITGPDLKKFLLEHKTGEKVKYSEYISTTSKKEHVMYGNIFITIKNSENGRDISKINPQEQEVLYERGSEFIVKEIKRISYNNYKIELEEVKHN